MPYRDNLWAYHKYAVVKDINNVTTSTIESTFNIIMDKKEFIKIMKKNHVPNFYYNIEGTGRDDERFYLNKDEHGWNVYYAERGCKTTNKYFNSESEALEYICKRLTE